MGSAFFAQAKAWTPAPPTGYSPVVGFKLFPPGGVYFDLGMWVLDYANDAAQVTTFIKHGDAWFAALTGGAICLSSAATCYYVYVEHATTVLQAARDSVVRGVVVDAWEIVLTAERLLEAPVSGLVAPYGMTLNDELTVLQAGSAALGVLLSAKAITKQIVDSEAHQRPAAAAIHVPGRMAALQAWRLLGSVAELSSFALASSVLHPLLVAPGYLLGVAANVYAVVNEDRVGGCVLSVVSPTVAMFGLFTTPVGLPWAKSRMPPVPGMPIMLATLVRLVAWGALCWTAEWQEGLAAGRGTLGRPMGRQVLQDRFLRPGAAAAEAVAACAGSAFAYATTLGKDDLACELQTADDETSGAALFRALLLGLVLISLPLYVLGLLLNLAFNGPFRRGEVDDDLTQKVRATDREIDAWGNQQEQA